MTGTYQELGKRGRVFEVFAYERGMLRATFVPGAASRRSLKTPSEPRMVLIHKDTLRKRFRRVSP